MNNQLLSKRTKIFCLYLGVKSQYRESKILGDLYQLKEFIMKRCPDQILKNLIFHDVTFPVAFYRYDHIVFTYNISSQTRNRWIQTYRNLSSKKSTVDIYYTILVFCLKHLKCYLWAGSIDTLMHGSPKTGIFLQAYASFFLYPLP